MIRGARQYISSRASLFAYPESRRSATPRSRARRPVSNRAPLFATLITLVAAGCGPPRTEVADVPPGLGGDPSEFLDICPRYSHDGRRIAFLRKTAGRKLQLFVATASLRDIRAVGPREAVMPDREFDCRRFQNRVPDRLEWSPADSEVALPRAEWFTEKGGERFPGAGIYACDVQTGRLRPLAIHPRKYDGWMFYFRAPAWSPDGRRLAWQGEGWAGESGLFVRTLAGTRPDATYNRFDRYDDATGPSWSPDGRFLAFRQGALRAFTAIRVETIRLIEPGGLTSRTLITEKPQAYDSSAYTGKAGTVRTSVRIGGIAWSPDGERIAYLRTETAGGSDSDVCVVDADTGDSRRLPRRDRSDNTEYHIVRWLGPGRIGALAAAGGESAAAIEIGVPEGGRSIRSVAILPSSDVDWSPDGQSLAASTGIPLRAPAQTTLVITRVVR